MATDIIGALGAGSGVDVKALATSLVDAEKVPREAVINNKIDDQSRKVSGYSALMLSLRSVKTAFQNLNDKTDFSAAQASVANTALLTASASSAAVPGRHTIEVRQLASQQRSAMGSFASASTALNNGSALSVSLTINSVAQSSISVTTATPQGVVDAINAADQGVTAQLLDTGDGSSNPFRIVLTGTMGADGVFSLSSDDGSGSEVAELALDASHLQTATDAIVDVNGLRMYRSSNTVDDAIPGVYIDLQSASIGSPTELRVTRDTTTIKENIKNLVSAYNLAIEDMDVLTGARSEDETDVYSGSLARDSAVTRIKSQLRTMFMADSTTPSGTMTAFRDIGLDIDQYGVMSIVDTTLDTALNDSFDDVVTMFSADTTNQTEVGDASRGLAGDALVLINGLIDSRGTIASQSSNATARISEFEDQLAALQIRMESLLARYTKQFAAMESIVGQTNSMRDSLTSTFEGMMAMYTK